MKKIISIVVAIVVVIAGIVFVPKLVHKCDSCGKVFVGAGYEPNLIEDFISDEEQIICKDCAEDQHALGTAFGKSLDDFKRDIF